LETYSVFTVTSLLNSGNLGLETDLEIEKCSDIVLNLGLEYLGFGLEVRHIC